ncbi:hypothetical protein [Streptomyces sp. NPDC001985]|uniref:hypothetical protein n=1 Tax=Streptomyces sp. NPDC001985 TaxID=3154406 RepID=UPI00333122D3
MRGLHIVGVHGIRQGAGATTEVLSDAWRTTLASAPEPPGGPLWSGPAGVAVTVPSYQGVFPRTRTRFIRLGPDEPEETETGPVGEEEETFILEALAAYSPSALVAEAGALADGGEDRLASAGTLGEEDRLTPRIRRRARAVNRVEGKGVTGRLLWIVREAHTYLREPGVGAAVRATVREALLRDDTAMVIAHSLGSVIFYDMLSRGEVPVDRRGAPTVTTLVTCGSPLRWLAVREGVHAAGGPLSVPDGVRWTNLYAPRDVVSRGTGLADLADGVTDARVHNGTLRAHDVHRYLDKPVISECAVRARAR